MNESPLRIVNEPESAERPLGRREVMRHLLGTAGAGIVIPGIAAAHPIHHHLANGDMMAAADAKATQLDWQPVFFDAHQNQTVIALAEQIVLDLMQPVSAQIVAGEFAVDEQDAAAQLLQMVDAAQEGALSRAGRSDDAGDGAGRNIEIDAFQHGHTGKALAQASHFNRNTGIAAVGLEGGFVNLGKNSSNHINARVMK